MFGSEIDIHLTMRRQDAENAIRVLEQRLEFLHKIEHQNGRETYLAVHSGKAGIVPLIMAIEAALKALSGVRH